MPHKLNLPRVPFPDARPNAARPNVVDPNLNHPSELLIDFSEDANDPPTPQQPSRGTPRVFTETFVIDDQVQDPFKMFYPTKRQKTDLPEIVASLRNCTAVISNSSRVSPIYCLSFVTENLACSLLPVYPCRKSQSKESR